MTHASLPPPSLFLLPPPSSPPPSVSCFALSRSHLIVGTHVGKIHLFAAAEVLGNDAKSLMAVEPETLTAHSSSVHHLLTLDGELDEGGQTSYFPTFVGRSERLLPIELLLSFGCGMDHFHHLDTAGMRRGVQRVGMNYMNAWMV